jgi:hypothetical protein
VFGKPERRERDKMGRKREIKGKREGWKNGGIGKVI